MLPVKLNHIINEAHNFLKVTLPKNTVFRMNIDITDSRVLADPTQIHQILVNLCTNAADAMADKGGVLEISLRDVNVDSANKAQFEGLSPGAYVELSVSDTGTGISQEVMKRIFDPFFTTKKVGKGTGMGLSVIHGIVKSHKGKIMVDSTPGKGTTFQIIFPKYIKAISKDLWKNKKQSNG
jgi:signal transduction histidine kinase